MMNYLQWSGITGTPDKRINNTTSKSDTSLSANRRLCERYQSMFIKVSFICSLLIFSFQTIACSCVERTLKQKYSSENYVFIARVTEGPLVHNKQILKGYSSSEPASESLLVIEDEKFKVSVIKSFKGNAPDFVYSSANNVMASSCDATVELNKAYLFMLSESQYMEHCSGSKELSEEDVSAFIEELSKY